MRSVIRRGSPALIGASALVATAVAVAPAAHAEVWDLNHKAEVTTTVKKAGKSVTFTGTQASKIDISKQSDNLTADLNLGTATMPVDLPLIPGFITVHGVGTATLRIEPLGPAKGTFNSGNVDVTQRFNIHVEKVTPFKLGWPNLVGKNCRTSSPVTMRLQGKITGLFDPFTLTGTYDIPTFANCGLLTKTVSNLTSGPGNTTKATFTP